VDPREHASDRHPFEVVYEFHPGDVRDDFRVGSDLLGVAHRQTVEEIHQDDGHEEYEQKKHRVADDRVQVERQRAERVELPRQHDDRFESRRLRVVEQPVVGVHIVTEHHVEAQREREYQYRVPHQKPQEGFRHAFEHLQVGGERRVPAHQQYQLAPRQQDDDGRHLVSDRHGGHVAQQQDGRETEQAYFQPVFQARQVRKRRRDELEQLAEYQGYEESQHQDPQAHRGVVGVRYVVRGELRDVVLRQRKLAVLDADLERQHGVRGQKRPEPDVKHQVHFVVPFDRQPLQMDETGQHGVAEQRPELRRLAHVQQRVGLGHVLRGVLLALQLRRVIAAVVRVVVFADPRRAQEVVGEHDLVVDVLRRLPVGFHAFVQMRLERLVADVGQRRIPQDVPFAHVRALVQQGQHEVAVVYLGGVVQARVALVVRQVDVERERTDLALFQQQLERPAVVAQLGVHVQRVVVFVRAFDRLVQRRAAARLVVHAFFAVQKHLYYVRETPVRGDENGLVRIEIAHSVRVRVVVEQGLDDFRQTEIARVLQVSVLSVVRVQVGFFRGSYARDEAVGVVRVEVHEQIVALLRFELPRPFRRDFVR